MTTPVNQLDSTIALIVAAGAGERVGGAVPKQYFKFEGKTLLERTVEVFLSHPRISGVRVVIARSHHPTYKKALFGKTLFPPVIGGENRQESVRRGLQALKHANPARVLVHDAARPLVTHALIDRMIDALAAHKAAIPAIPVADTLRYMSNDESKTITREQLYAVQTPQAFHYEALLAAHEQLAGLGLTDDAALFEKLGKQMTRVDGEANNFKITTQADMERFMEILAAQAETRTAMGYDVHRLLPHASDVPMTQRYIRLCGVNIPHSHYLEGHSDADVGLHALVDALLGTMSEGDIGSHFPPEDKRWKGADSSRFLMHAFELLSKRSGQIIHLDLTLICEAPKIAPHREAMRGYISKLLKLDIGRISIKATTTEKLGFEGRAEGIAAQAIATVRLPRV